MQIPKPSPEDMDRFRSIVPAAANVAVKPMFGNLGAFVNGNMFMGLFGADIGLKLAADHARELQAMDGAGPFGPAERPMGGYVTMPAAIIGTPDGDRWVARALAHVGELPPKEQKK
jgi:TfoX/Sxy family transcriptional regulator of competence genes